MNFSKSITFRRRPQGAAGPSPRGFTLIELLVVLALGSLLVMLVGATASGSLRKAENIQCLAQLRSLGSATLIYAQDHNGNFPRSGHSAASARERGWAFSIAPYVGDGLDPSAPDWQDGFNRYYRCPVDSHTETYQYSYAFNVYFEVNPDGDDYVGAPATWRKLMQVPAPSKTILLGEGKSTSFADHLMCHMWGSLQAANNALDGQRHGRSANYLFVDGHAESLAVEDTFDPSRNRNRWNPSLAGAGG